MFPWRLCVLVYQSGSKASTELPQLMKMDRFATSMVSFLTCSYAAFLCLVELMLFAYKGVYLADRTWVYVLEIVLFLTLIASEFCLQAVKSTKEPLVFVLYLLSTFLVTYFIFWQQYVLFIELVFTSVFLLLKLAMSVGLTVDFFLFGKN